MARATSSVLLVLAAVALAARCSAQTVPLPNGRDVIVPEEPVQVNEPTTTPTDRSGDVTVDPADQQFRARNTVFGNAKVGVDPDQEKVVIVEGSTDPSTNDPGNRKLLRAARKMLQETTGLTRLNLEGEGVGAGNDVAGVDANAYGQGRNQDLLAGGTHVEPHGANVEPTVNGEKTTVSADVNPDCAFDERNCVRAGK